MTTPSASPLLLSTVVGENGVGDHRGGRVAETLLNHDCYPSRGKYLQPLANAGSERPWVSLPRNRGPVMFLACLYSQIAWLMARMWSSLKLFFRGDPRCPEVPKSTRWPGSETSGLWV